MDLPRLIALLCEHQSPLFNVNSADDIQNVYLVGSRVYGNHSADSDYDFFVVSWKKTPTPDFLLNTTHADAANVSVCVYHPLEFATLIGNNDQLALICLSVPEHCVWKEQIPFRASARLNFLKAYGSAGRYAAIARLKTRRYWKTDHRKAKKNIVHGLRCIQFCEQMTLESGAIAIRDFQSANTIYNEVMANESTAIEEYDAVYAPMIIEGGRRLKGALLNTVEAAVSDTLAERSEEAHWTAHWPTSLQEAAIDGCYEAVGGELFTIGFLRSRNRNDDVSVLYNLFAIRINSRSLPLSTAHNRNNNMKLVQLWYDRESVNQPLAADTQQQQSLEESQNDTTVKKQQKQQVNSQSAESSSSPQPQQRQSFTLWQSAVVRECNGLILLTQTTATETSLAVQPSATPVPLLVALPTTAASYCAYPTGIEDKRNYFLSGDTQLVQSVVSKLTKATPAATATSETELIYEYGDSGIIVNVYWFDGEWRTATQISLDGSEPIVAHYKTVSNASYTGAIHEALQLADVSAARVMSGLEATASGMETVRDVFLDVWTTVEQNSFPESAADKSLCFTFELRLPFTSANGNQQQHTATERFDLSGYQSVGIVQQQQQQQQQQQRSREAAASERSIVLIGARQMTTLSELDIIQVAERFHWRTPHIIHRGNSAIGADYISLATDIRQMNPLYQSGVVICKPIVVPNRSAVQYERVVVHSRQHIALKRLLTVIYALQHEHNYGYHNPSLSPPIEVIDRLHDYWPLSERFEELFGAGKRKPRKQQTAPSSSNEHQTQKETNQSEANTEKAEGSNQHTREKPGRRAPPKKRPMGVPNSEADVGRVIVRCIIELVVVSKGRFALADCAQRFQIPQPILDCYHCIQSQYVDLCERVQCVHDSNIRQSYQLHHSNGDDNSSSSSTTMEAMYEWFKSLADGRREYARFASRYPPRLHLALFAVLLSSHPESVADYFAANPHAYLQLCGRNDF